MIPRIDTTMGKISSRPLCSILEFQYNRMHQIKHFARKVNQFNRSKLVSELIYNIQAKQIPHIDLPKRKRSAAISYHRRQKCQIEEQRNHENHIRMTRSLTCRRRKRAVRVWIDRRPPRPLNERRFRWDRGAATGSSQVRRDRGGFQWICRRAMGGLGFKAWVRLDVIEPFAGPVDRWWFLNGPKALGFVFGAKETLNAIRAASKARSHLFSSHHSSRVAADSSESGFFGSLDLFAHVAVIWSSKFTIFWFISKKFLVSKKISSLTNLGIPMVLPAVHDGASAPTIDTGVCNRCNTSEGCKPILSTIDGLMAPPMGKRLGGRFEPSPTAGVDAAAASFAATATAKISVDATLAGDRCKASCSWLWVCP